MQRKWIILIGFLVLGILFWQPIKTHVKTIFLLTREFPQAPVKPLIWVTSSPAYQEVTLGDGNEENVVGTLILPTRGIKIYQPKQKTSSVSSSVNAKNTALAAKLRRNPERELGELHKKNSLPAVILAMGVKTKEEDRPILIGFADTLARLGYVVFWPRSEELNRGVANFENPEVFVRAFEYVAGVDVVDPERISFMGFSVGSSVALVSATDEEIRDRVRSVIFFGGYYDIRTYLTALEADDEWQPSEGAVAHFGEILTTRGFGSWTGLSENTLDSISPSAHIENLEARVFILHDKGDAYVPYQASEKLHEALPEKGIGKFTILNLFDHVQPKKGFSKETLGEFAKVYMFIYSVLRYL